MNGQIERIILGRCICRRLDINWLSRWRRGDELACQSRDAGDTGLISGWGRSEVGSGNPLQCSCLENSMDRGAWQATVQGAQECRLRLSSHTHDRRLVLGFSALFSLFTPQRTSFSFVSGRSWDHNAKFLPEEVLFSGKSVSSVLIYTLLFSTFSPQDFMGKEIQNQIYTSIVHCQHSHISKHSRDETKRLTKTYFLWKGKNEGGYVL